ncbi:MAG: polysaccharide biosynthesis/export family protein [Pseudanabaenaceae cyanobacterium bins.68]|nr:polysaccharide biosynthesis/export family protein [Pseudanabaenaceae cyanobacterium bins.68]
MGSKLISNCVLALVAGLGLEWGWGNYSGVAIAQNSNPKNFAAYILGPGDILDVAVLGYEQFTTKQVILPDGTISIPEVGTVFAAGQTIEALQQDLLKRFKRVVIEPSVVVRLSTLRPVLVNVSGAVQRPGPIQLQPIGIVGTTGAVQAPTVSIALSLVGGVTREADLRGVVLRRFVPNDEPVSLTLDLVEAASSLNGPPDILLRDGDAVFVPKLSAPDRDAQELIARSTFAPRGIRIAVVGEVRAPGEREVQPNISVSRAIAIAGGYTDKANLMAVGFLRVGRDGKVKQQGVNVSDLNDTTQLQDGDLIVVPKTDITAALDTVGNILSPLFNSILLLRAFGR